MSPEIAAKYQATYRYWTEELGNSKQKTLRDPTPLSFDLPADADPNLGDSPLFADGLITPYCLYQESYGTWRRWLFYVWVFGLSFSALGLLMITVDFFARRSPFFYEWVFLILPLLFAAWAYPIWKHRPRLGCNVFDREAGKIYLYMGKDKPHLPLDFYEQYFYTQQATLNGINEFGALFIVPREKLAMGHFRTHAPRRIAWGGEKADGQAAWYALLRFMDTSKPFDNDEINYFQFVKQRKEKQGYKVQGICWPNGRVDWV